MCTAEAKREVAEQQLERKDEKQNHAARAPVGKRTYVPVDHINAMMLLREQQGHTLLQSSLVCGYRTYN